MKPETRRKVLNDIMRWLHANGCIIYEGDYPTVYRSSIVMAVEEVQAMDHRTIKRWIQYLARYEYIQRIDERLYRVMIHQETIESALLKVR